MESKFILVQCQGALVAIDQHALHERLNLEHLEAEYEKKNHLFENLPNFTKFFTQHRKNMIVEVYEMVNELSDSENDCYLKRRKYKRYKDDLIEMLGLGCSYGELPS